MTTDPFSGGNDAEAAAFLSGGNTSAKFPKVGHTVEGTVTGWEMRQQTDYDTGGLLTWRDGKPRMQLLITIQGEPTGVTYEDGVEVELPDDDGVRTLFVKGGLQKGIGKALRDAKGKLEAGAYVKVTRGKDGPKTDPKKKAPHTYQVVWTPAAQNPKAAEALLATDDPFAA
jgi:hypothetical protein